MSERNELQTDALAQLTAGLKKLAVADFAALDESGAPPAAAEAFCLFNKLSKMFKEVFEFSRALSGGDLSVTPPPRSNYLAMGLKAIHSQLLHVVWQAEQIAAGDYSQSIDFMGEFGKTFNWAVESLKKQRGEFDSNRKMMLDLFDSLHSIIILIDGEAGKIVFSNERARFVCGTRTTMENDKRGGLFAHLFKLAAEPSVNAGDMIYWDACSSSWYKIIMAETRWTEEKNVKLFNCVDITKEQVEYEHMKESAFDAITGLYVRAQGLPKVEELFRKLNPNLNLCLAFFDLDGLKRVNDTLGHAVGDNLIRRFADAMKRTYRAADVMIRMGGDEFVAAFTARNEKIIQDILARFAENVEAENTPGEVRLEYSYGYCVAAYQENITIAQMVEHADGLMYLHKKARKEAKGMNINDR